MVLNDKINIGMVNFINTAPLYEVWKERAAAAPHEDWQVIEGPPSRLNRMLYNGELDLGFISSHEYALHPDKYRILDGLSISAQGEVGSVFLFSELPIAALDGQTVALSPQSQTSNALIRIILEDYYHIRPHYVESGEAPARLAIGDRALRLKAENRFPLVLDLSQEWQRHSGLPFVFAIWAVREECWKNRGAEVRAIQRELLTCVEIGRRRLKEISAGVAERIPMPPAACHEYLRRIEFDLSPAKVQGLSRFYQKLIDRREVSPRALPLKIL
ncbi:hypothetical protein MNBD_DELTA03-894 [hydrothermal vent metagenome]|uniref:Chorismate dehydratase n=1 Tax=hydrothermal vent metagenome TaxID=652676 RepID=A0A3B0VRL0_9ZZZZ